MRAARTIRPTSIKFYVWRFACSQNQKKPLVRFQQDVNFYANLFWCEKIWWRKSGELWLALACRWEYFCLNVAPWLRDNTACLRTSLVFFGDSLCYESSRKDVRNFCCAWQTHFYLAIYNPDPDIMRSWRERRKTQECQRMASSCKANGFRNKRKKEQEWVSVLAGTNSALDTWQRPQV